MRRLTYAVPVVLALSTLLLAAVPAAALPSIASGSKCKSTWVNNPEAMACFIQGQEDIRNGVSRPHYVACTSDGAIHCCVDTANGQECEGVSESKTGGRRHLEDLQMSALLLAQQTIMGRLAHIEGVLDDLKATIGEANVCSAPDYVPLALPGIAGPAAYCRLSGDLTKLQVLVYNQGSADTSAAGTETRVTFNTASGPLPLPNPAGANTSVLASGGSQILEFPIPANCTSTTAGAYCDFTVGVDVGNTVAESSETNNSAPGTCFIRLF